MMIVFAAVAVGLIVSAVAVASQGKHSRSTQARGSANAAAHLAALDRSPTDTDAIPSRLQPSLEHAPAVLDQKAGRKASQQGGIGSYIVPTDDGGICLLLDDVADGYGTTSCGTAADANAGRIFSVGSGPDGHVLVAGVAPDGVSTVGVSYVDGTSADVVVQGNSFQVVGTARPSKIAWSSGDVSGGYTFPRVPATPATD
jgi:hypothetical protein